MIRRNDSMKSRASAAHAGFHGSRFRHDRFFYVLNEGWYIETRSGDFGPFSSHETAQHFLETTYSRRAVH